MALEYAPTVAAPDLFNRACALNPCASELLWSVVPVCFEGRNHVGRPRTFGIDSDDGQLAIILPAYDDCGRLVDCAAFDPNDPGRCAMRGGAWMVGANNAAELDPDGDRLLVHHDWRGWFIHGGAGALILNHAEVARVLAETGIKLATTSEIARQHLSNLLTLSVRPSIDVLTSQEAA